jgi:hypothetical protein
MLKGLFKTDMSYRRSFNPFAPDLMRLIVNCCLDNSDQAFERFQLAWNPYLEAALARFITDWKLARLVSNAAYTDYRNAFRKPFNPDFDYRAYFVAIAYAHLLCFSGSLGLHLLLRRIGVSPKGPGSDVLIFCAIFRLPDVCVFDLLTQCFHPVTFGLRSASATSCEVNLAKTLRLAFS